MGLPVDQLHGLFLDAKIRAAIKRELVPGMKYHVLRTRWAGAQRFADYHLLVPGKLPVKAAHDGEVAIGRAIQTAVPGMEIDAHIGSVEEPLAYEDHAPLVGNPPVAQVRADLPGDHPQAM